MNMPQLHRAIDCASRALDYIQPVKEEDSEGVATELGLLWLYKMLLETLASAEMLCSTSDQFGLMSWKESQELIKELDERIKAKRDAWKTRSSSTTTTQENA